MSEQQSPYDLGTDGGLPEGPPNEQECARFKVIRECVAAERKKCCQDMCLECETDKYPVQRRPNDSGVWQHWFMVESTKHTTPCDASAIRERAAEEKE